MGLSVWTCVLYSLLQAGVLSQTLRCAPGTSQGCGAQGLVTNDADEQYTDHAERQRSTLHSGTERHTLRAMRRHRDPEHRRTTQHLSQSGQPGAITVRGFPNALIQAERARRHLPMAAAAVKKSKRKPRVGSFSLIINNNPSAPLQISRARRQVKTDPPKRGKSGRSGAYSVLGDPQADGQTDTA
ncbi:hypothetical protein NHX12_021709 [Muraenolepis orangiensis]|uniref:Uncharacterized protein n=1 Tax=Muraenolepis orangiensis TaxID=630683 RepID=A0A9Q0IVE0_9TELE|nr:hypothetical protein NHX12_021709 [Muraenolepis orangiensis]